MFTHFHTVLVLFISASFTQGQEVSPYHGFVYADQKIAGIQLELRYNSVDNFIGKRIDGYEADVLILSEEATKALENVQKELNEMGLALKVFDAYRPQKAVNHFMEWAKDPSDILTKQKYYPDLKKDVLFDLGYISARSGHTRGSTVDLTIVEIDTEEELDMGSTYDFFGEISHHSYSELTEIQKSNRKLLKQVMNNHGFRSYSKEWWHYTLIDEPYPDTYFDFDVK